MPTAHIAKNLEQIRNKKGYTQEQIANFLGVSRLTYGNIENGKRDVTVKELEQLSAFYNIPLVEIFDTPRNNDKFEQMYFYVLDHFKDRGIPKTKLAKILYLADFSCFYDNLEPMSGVRYVRREYGPVADTFFELTEDLYDKGKINIETLDYAFLIKPSSRSQDYDLLTDEDKQRLDKICSLWKDRRTSEIVNYTHEQKPWKSCRDGEYIPYELIIQEDPDHVYAPSS